MLRNIDPPPTLTYLVHDESSFQMFQNVWFTKILCIAIFAYKFATGQNFAIHKEKLMIFSMWRRQSFRIHNLLLLPIFWKDEIGGFIFDAISIWYMESTLHAYPCRYTKNGKKSMLACARGEGQHLFLCFIALSAQVCIAFWSLAKYMLRNPSLQAQSSRLREFIRIL